MVSTDEEKVKNTTSDGSGKDITNEVEVDEDEVEIFSVEELVPDSTPITVPYLELYRTNELEYVPYMSPYNVGIQSDSSDTSDTSASDTPTDENNADGNNADGNNTDGNNTDGTNSSNSGNSTTTS